MRTIALLIPCLLLLCACTKKPVKVEDYPGAKPFDHREFDALLRKHVDKQGRVDYPGLMADRQKLKSYLSELASADWKKMRNRSERFAFWINAYNACCLERVLATLPADKSKWKDYSVRDVSRFFKKKAFKVSGQEMSLDNIEHDILRPQFSDARVHFSIVCASGGCPQLLAEAFVPDKLEAQLRFAAEAFINNPDKVKFDLAKKQMQISKIFNWFSGDFQKESGTVQKFISQHVTDKKLAESLRTQKWGTDHLDYSWKLNRQP